MSDKTFFIGDHVSCSGSDRVYRIRNFLIGKGCEIQDVATGLIKRVSQKDLTIVDAPEDCDCETCKTHRDMQDSDANDLATRHKY